MTYIKILLAAVLFLAAPASFAARTSTIGAGESFPDMALDKPLGADAASYLGIPENVGFSLSQVQSDLILVEFLSIYCPHCQMQVEHFNRLREMIEADSATRGRIKLLGIAVASKAPEVEKFMAHFKVAYPMVPDPNFELYHAVGAGLTPFSVYVRRTGPGQAGVVAGTHNGLIDKPKELLSELRRFAESYPDELIKVAKEKDGMPLVLAPVIPDEELETRLVSTFARLGGRCHYSLFTPRPSQRTAGLYGRHPSWGEPKKAFCRSCNAPFHLRSLPRRSFFLCFRQLREDPLIRAYSAHQVGK